MSGEFEGRVALVTAAAGAGIGQAVARRLAAGGASVVVTDIHERRTKEVTAAIASDFPDVTVVGYAMDASDRGHIDEVVADVCRSLGPIRILVNNATNHDFPAFVTGLGGRSIYQFQTPIAGSVVRYNANYGAMRVVISPQRVAFAFFSIANPVVPIDVFELSACYADCDQSTGPGILDLVDYLCFAASFINSTTYACDCDTSTGPLVCDLVDFVCFQSAFVSGCQ